jgi:hypothetical protein
MFAAGARAAQIEVVADARVGRGRAQEDVAEEDQLLVRKRGRLLRSGRTEARHRSDEIDRQRLPACIDARQQACRDGFLVVLRHQTLLPGRAEPCGSHEHVLQAAVLHGHGHVRRERARDEVLEDLEVVGRIRIDPFLEIAARCRRDEGARDGIGQGHAIRQQCAVGQQCAIGEVHSVGQKNAVRQRQTIGEVEPVCERGAVRKRCTIGQIEAVGQLDAVVFHQVPSVLGDVDCFRRAGGHADENDDVGLTHAGVPKQRSCRREATDFLRITIASNLARKKTCARRPAILTR